MKVPKAAITIGMWIWARSGELRARLFSLQLSGPSNYEGGELMIQAGDGDCAAEKARGTLIAFPSYVLHRVAPVTTGVRKSLVIWVAGPEFR